MAERPLFSIVVPVYNTKKELPRCVQSILGQSFDDYELILVDDGSKDGSAELIDEFVKKDTRIVSVHQENMGSSEARNTGIKKSKGKYIVFADSDDELAGQNALASLYQKINEDKEPDLICYGVRIIDNKGRIEKERIPHSVSYSPQEKLLVLSHLVYQNEYISPAYVKAIKNNLFENDQLFFKKGITGEDIGWSAWVMMHCTSISVIPYALYNRIRRNEGAITSNIGRKSINDILSQIEQGIIDAGKYAENNDFYAVYLEYWAYQYAMLLGLVYRLKNEDDYNSYIGRLIKLKYLLKYDRVKKVKAVHLACSLLGIRNTIKLLGIYYGKVHA